MNFDFTVSFLNRFRFGLILFLTLSLVACVPSETSRATEFVSSQFRDAKIVEFQNLKSKDAIVCGEVSFSDKKNVHKGFKRFVVKKMTSGLSGTVEDFGSFGIFEGFKIDELILKEAATKYIIHLGHDFSARQQKIKNLFPEFVPDEDLQKILLRHRRAFDFYRTHDIGWGVEAKIAGDKLGGPIAFEEAYSASCSFT